MKIVTTVPFTATAALLVSLTGVSAAQNWPQWRGPLASGVAPDANPPVEWSESKNIKWKVPLPGGGSSTPIVWGDRVFVTAAINTGKRVETAATATAQPPNPPAAREAPKGPPGGDRAQQRPRPDDPGGKGGPGGRRGGGYFGGAMPAEVHQFVVLCLDRGTGRTLWQQVAREEVPHEGHHPTGTFASASPVTDGKLLFVFFGSRGLYCYDLDGSLKWQQDLGDMRTIMGFGEGASPALRGDVLVVNWDHEGEDFIAALDKRTGQTLWKTPREERTSWATPLIVEHAGKPQVIVPASARTRSYDLATGKLLWECAGLTSNVIPSPVVGHGLVFVTSGYRGHSLQAIKLGRTGDLTGTDAIAWSLNRSTPYVPSPLLYGSRLYFLKLNDATLSACSAEDGKPLYEEQRLEGIRGVYASPVAAAGRVYIAGRDGGVVVIKDSDHFEVLAANKLHEGIDASPVLVDNEILLRGKQHLYCIAAK